MSTFEMLPARTRKYNEIAILSLGSKGFAAKNVIFRWSKSANFVENVATNPEFRQFRQISSRINIFATTPVFVISSVFRQKRNPLEPNYCTVTTFDCATAIAKRSARSHRREGWHFSSSVNKLLVVSCTGQLSGRSSTPRMQRHSSGLSVRRSTDSWTTQRSPWCPFGFTDRLRRFGQSQKRTIIHLQSSAVFYFRF